jgi:hypothetical protein
MIKLLILYIKFLCLSSFNLSINYVIGIPSSLSTISIYVPLASWSAWNDFYKFNKYKQYFLRHLLLEKLKSISSCFIALEFLFSHAFNYSCTNTTKISNKHLKKISNPSNILISKGFHGIGHSIIPLTISRSNLNPSCDITNIKYVDYCFTIIS